MNLWEACDTQSLSTVLRSSQLQYEMQAPCVLYSKIEASGSQYFSFELAQCEWRFHVVDYSAQMPYLHSTEQECQKFSYVWLSPVNTKLIKASSKYRVPGAEYASLFARRKLPRYVNRHAVPGADSERKEQRAKRDLGRVGWITWDGQHAERHLSMKDTSCGPRRVEAPCNGNCV